MADTPKVRFESKMLIDGKLVGGEAGTFKNVNPATEEVLGEVADASKADMHRAIDAARRAFDETDWSTNRAFRKRCLEQLQAALEAEREDLREELILEAGCPRLLTHGPQLDAPLADALTYPAKLIDEYPWDNDLGDTFVALTGQMTTRKVWRESVGVVGAIVPWNFPFEVSIHKLGQALATGNTVVLKPAPDTPFNATWWPLNMTWGGLPASVPPGYIAYFVLPAVIGASLGRTLSSRFEWRRPIALLSVGLIVGCLWALLFNAIIGARLGVFYYGRVISGLALWEGTKHQYPLYDALAMGVQMMVFTYILGRTDPQGRTVIDVWADSKSNGRLQSALLSIAAAVVVGHVVYGSVFAPHLATKLLGLVHAGPTEQLFEGVPNQPR